MVDLPNIRNITVSGRIGSGATTLAVALAKKLDWKFFDGGALFRKISSEIGISIVNSNSRPDHFDLDYEKRIKQMLANESGHIIQSHLAGFDAQGIEGVYKILVACTDAHGHDKMDIRIDRLVNRDGISVDKAKEDIIRREQEHLTKFRRLYADNDPNWVYWDKNYYDLVINTYSHNKEEALAFVLSKIGFKK